METTDFKVLEKYLSEDELKEIAIEQARNVFNDRYKNCEDYIFKEAASSMLKDEIKDQIKSNNSIISEKVDNGIKDIGEFEIKYSKAMECIISKEIELRQSDIKKEVNKQVDILLSSDESGSIAYRCFDNVKDAFGDMLYGIIEKYFKNEKTN